MMQAVIDGLVIGTRNIHFMHKRRPRVIRDGASVRGFLATDQAQLMFEYDLTNTEMAELEALLLRVEDRISSEVVGKFQQAADD